MFGVPGAVLTPHQILVAMVTITLFMPCFATLLMVAREHGTKVAAGISDDGQAIAGKVDASILVVRAWQEQRGLVSRLAGQLGQAKAAFLGVILNRPRNTAGGYFRKNFEAMASYASDAKD